MTGKSSLIVPITIDFKQNRIRIHRAMLKSLNSPKYIQLLVNPDKKHIAIRGLKVAVPGDQSEKIKPQEFMNDSSYELKSKSFLTKLHQFLDSPDPAYTYRLTGTIVSELNMAIFSTKTLTRVDN